MCVSRKNVQKINTFEDKNICQWSQEKEKKNNLRAQFYQSKLLGLSCSEDWEPFHKDSAQQLIESDKKPQQLKSDSAKKTNKQKNPFSSYGKLWLQ